MTPTLRRWSPAVALWEGERRFIDYLNAILSRYMEENDNSDILLTTCPALTVGSLYLLGFKDISDRNDIFKRTNKVVFRVSEVENNHASRKYPHLQLPDDECAEYEQNTYLEIIFGYSVQFGFPNMHPR